MAKFRSLVASALLLACPAAADVALVGGPKIGLESETEVEKCDSTENEAGICERERFENSFGTGMSSRNLPSGIKISGEASMGLVFDGENLGVQNDISIHIHFETSLDSGFSAGGKITLDSE
ncbi:MAG: hypothetical protein OXI87_19865 [Albidovulum sp.]|nr:hypothetical protein [Albidovulum sp.]